MEDKPHSHRTVREISRKAGDPSINNFAYYAQRCAVTRLAVIASETREMWRNSKRI